MPNWFAPAELQAHCPLQKEGAAPRLAGMGQISIFNILIERITFVAL